MGVQSWDPVDFCLESSVAAALAGSLGSSSITEFCLKQWTFLEETAGRRGSRNLGRGGYEGIVLYEILPGDICSSRWWWSLGLSDQDLSLRG